MSTSTLTALSWPPLKFLCMKRLRRMPSAAARIGVFSIMGPLGGRTSLRKETAALLLHGRPSVGIGQRAFHLTSTSVRCDRRSSVRYCWLQHAQVLS